VSLESKYLKEMVNLMILGVQMLRDKELKPVPQNNQKVNNTLKLIKE